MAIPSWLKKDGDSILYNGDGYFAFFIPERYFDGKNSAKAIIMGEVWYKVQVELPKVYHEEIRTNKTYKSLTFKIINNRTSIPPSKNNKSYDIEDKVIFKNKLFPIGLYLETKHELKIIGKNEKDILLLTIDGNEKINIYSK